jgi:hypothetical protein
MTSESSPSTVPPSATGQPGAIVLSETDADLRGGADRRVLLHLFARTAIIRVPSQCKGFPSARR